MPPSRRAQVQRLLFDPLFIGATDEEVGAELGVPEALVAEARESFLRFTEVAEAVIHARHVARATGYRGRVWSLIHEALAEYEKGR